ncbi:FRG domain-containing protein [Rhodopirellula sp. MGV]|uniref:FRG domain-containing protein n=1 Tax=Rhodopirellula sp. MGV TaxID=2023130 RepID=UPI001E37741F|nr:FRG domain-containing protein [Rhodopirellula sp. MGV]
MERDRFVFRGHQSADWCLTPSFDRTYSSIPLERRPKLAKELMENFTRYVGEYDPKSIRSRRIGPDEDEMWLMALAQHHGLPTRLLDWSRSPYIASYFAFTDLLISGMSCESTHVAIWAMDTTSEIWSEHCGVRLVKVPRHIDERIRNQGGLFSLSVIPLASLEDHHRSMDPASPALTKFLVPQEEAAVAIEDLHTMDIHHAQLFPGYEGCVRAARIQLAPTLAKITPARN